MRFQLCSMPHRCISPHPLGWRIESEVLNLPFQSEVKIKPAKKQNNFDSKGIRYVSTLEWQCSCPRCQERQALSAIMGIEPNLSLLPPAFDRLVKSNLNVGAGSKWSSVFEPGESGLWSSEDHHTGESQTLRLNDLLFRGDMAQHWGI